jgi:hypothetical protein
MRIYVDESGDLGWTLDRPFRQGGSSRYLTLACLVLPTPHYKRPRKLIARLYKKYGWRAERKAADATPAQKATFCHMATALLRRYPEIKLDIITVQKSNVQDHIRQDANKLYNFMLGLVIPDHVSQEQDIELMTDARSIKVKSQNSLRDYLQIKLWFDARCPTRVIHLPAVSAQDYTLQFIDWVAHCVWLSYEDGLKTFLNILGGMPTLRTRELFFSPAPKGQAAPATREQTLPS